MDITPALLLERLDAIGRALRDSGHALALIGLGSVGNDTARLDAWSDLDFFAIVEPGWVRRYLENLDWLAAAHPVAWSYRNTRDGHKALMADGVFCEFAVFEPQALADIPFAPGRVVWKRDDVDPSIAQPRRPLPGAAPSDETYLVGEILGCLLVGLQRWRRGEKLSAARMVQGRAVDRLIELDALRRAPASGDPFNCERRLETRQPELGAELPLLVPGYSATPAAAEAMLEALSRRGALLNGAVVARIRALITA